MPSAETLRGLLEKVEAASEGSQDLDEAVHGALRSDDPWWQAIVEGRRLVAAGQPNAYIDHPNAHMRADSWAQSSRVVSTSTSVDSALALVERVLPKWRRYLEEANSKSGLWWCGLCRPGPRSGVIGTDSAYAATAPLAILAALLRALIAQSEEASRG